MPESNWILYTKYPFQVAALPTKTTTHSSMGGDDEELEFDQVSAIFELLLRPSPACCCRRKGIVTHKVCYNLIAANQISIINL
jgi:hypothetical protein